MRVSHRYLASSRPKGCATTTIFSRLSLSPGMCPSTWYSLDIELWHIQPRWCSSIRLERSASAQEPRQSSGNLVHKAVIASATAVGSCSPSLKIRQSREGRSDSHRHRNKREQLLGGETFVRKARKADAGQRCVVTRIVRLDYSDSIHILCDTESVLHRQKVFTPMVRSACISC